MRSVGAVLGIVLVLVMFSTLLIPTLTEEQEHGPDVRTSWEWDDYRPAGDITTATGAIETVPIGEDTYLHAVGVGTARLVTSDGAVQTVRVGRAVLDLVLIDGQSNAAQNTQDLSLAPVPERGTAYYFGSETRYAEAGRIESQEALDTALASQLATWSFQPMVDDETGAVRIGDKAPGIARTYVEATGHRIYIVDCAVPGSALKLHDGVDRGYCWQWAEAVVGAAVDAVDTDLVELRFTGIDLWLQGESDAKRPTATYLSNWPLYYGPVTEGGLGIPVDHIVICLIAGVTDENGAVNTALRQIAEDYPKCSIGASAEDFTVSGGELNPDDGLHYTQIGDNIIGEEWGRSAARIVLDDRDRPLAVVETIAGMVPVLILVMIVLTCLGLAVRRY